MTQPQKTALFGLVVEYLMTAKTTTTEMPLSFTDCLSGETYDVTDLLLIVERIEPQPPARLRSPGT